MKRQGDSEENPREEKREGGMSCKSIKKHSNSTNDRKEDIKGISHYITTHRRKNTREMRTNEKRNLSTDEKTRE